MQMVVVRQVSEPDIHFWTVCIFLIQFQFNFNRLSLIVTWHVYPIQRQMTNLSLIKISFNPLQFKSDKIESSIDANFMHYLSH